MKKFKTCNIIRFVILIGTIATLFSFSEYSGDTPYQQHYVDDIKLLQQCETKLLTLIQEANLELAPDRVKVLMQLQNTRNAFKPVDFWMRYLDPLAHKKINGPLPIEWETEVFEKFEKPYRREGAGFTLAYQYLEEPNPDKTVLLDIIKQAQTATQVYLVDSIKNELKTFHHFYFCNRLFLLNLAAIYTTGFECPDTDNIISELQLMLSEMKITYKLFNQSFPQNSLSKAYLELYEQTIQFVNNQPHSYETFDHFTFIRDFVNPLYTINYEHILKHKAFSKNLLDYSLNKQAASIFSKTLYNGQNPKGIFLRLNDSAKFAELEHVGKLLFYDPILSQNNMRSCASCHKPNQYFTDTSFATALHFNQKEPLARNTPSLLNAQYNHLLMADGGHFTLVGQTIGVITNPNEMGSTENEVVKKIMSCKEYATTFKKLLAYTPQEKEVTIEHISSALTYYYGKFSKYNSPFDAAMNKTKQLSPAEQNGFNIFMSKAQCATCHFVPQFNGVKPPYIGSEFEVIGVPSSPTFASLSQDKGRFMINPAEETLNAFRTGTIRNAANTKPYMHNGILKTLEEVIDFYNNGGGAGRGLDVPNQTLSTDSLHLTQIEKVHLIAFISTLSENIQFENPPTYLPKSKNKKLNNRQIGGTY